MSKTKVKPDTNAVIVKQEQMSGGVHSAPKTTDGKVVRMPGRPVVEGSERQLRLAEQEFKRKNGLMKKGRPVDETSAKQQRVAELNEKKRLGIGGPGWSKNKIKIAVAEGQVKLTPAEYLKYVGEPMPKTGK